MAERTVAGAHRRAPDIGKDGADRSVRVHPHRRHGRKCGKRRVRAGPRLGQPTARRRMVDRIDERVGTRGRLKIDCELEATFAACSVTP